MARTVSVLITLSDWPGGSEVVCQSQQTHKGIYSIYFNWPDRITVLLFLQCSVPLDMSLPSTPDIKIKEEEPVEVDSSPPDSPVASPRSPQSNEKVSFHELSSHLLF